MKLDPIVVMALRVLDRKAIGGHDLVDTKNAFGAGRRRQRERAKEQGKKESRGSEHASFTFSVEGVSRALTHQLVRHRIASYTQQSQRYVTYDTLEQYVTPPSILKDKEAKRIYDETLMSISDAYQELLKYELPKEDARFTLPNAAKTNILITMNARELCHFFKLRCCARSQWEIRKMAMKMLKLAKQAAPVIFENAGPSCIELTIARKES